MVTFDDGAAPLIYVKFSWNVSETDVTTVFSEYMSVLNRHERVAWVVDMREINPLSISAGVRRTYADAFERNRKRIEAKTIGRAVVVRSKVVQGIITAVEWLVKQSYPSRNFTQVDTAREWALQLLSEHELRAPAVVPRPSLRAPEL